VRDWRIEKGRPTEFDTEAAHIDWEAQRNWRRGYGSDYTRLTLLVDREERAAAAEVCRNATPSMRPGSIEEVTPCALECRAPTAERPSANAWSGHSSRCGNIAGRSSTGMSEFGGWRGRC
jgi:hypothetical protein